MTAPGPPNHQNQPQDADRGGGQGLAAAETALIVALFFVAAGDPAPAVNEQHYLSRWKHYWDPSWCQGDLFLESPDAHLTIVLLAGWTTKLLPITAVAWMGRLAAWTLLAIAWRRLSWTVAPYRWCALLSASLWLVGMEQMHLAGEWVIGGVEAKCFAYAFWLFALAALIQDRWRAVWVHLGYASALHVLVGGWSVLIALGVWATRGVRRPRFSAMLPGILVGGLISLAGLVPPLVMNAGTDAEQMSVANQIYVFDRLPHHLAPLTKEPDWVLERVGLHWIMLVLLAIASRWAWRQTAASQTTNQQPLIESGDRLVTLCRFAWGCALLSTIGFLIELLAWDHPAVAAKLLRFYWFRMSDIAAPLAVGLVTATAIGAGLRHRQWKSLTAVVVVGGLVIAHLGPETLSRMREPCSPSDTRVKDLPAWIEMARWIEENTPEDAVLLSPRYANSLRWRTGRAEVVNWKDIPQDAANMIEWRRRIDHVYSLPGDQNQGLRARSLGHLGANRLRELADEYGADYVVTDLRRRVSLPGAYSNRTYIVYDLRDRKRTTRQSKLPSN